MALKIQKKKKKREMIPGGLQGKEERLKEGTLRGAPRLRKNSSSRCGDANIREPSILLSCWRIDLTVESGVRSLRR